MPSYDLLLKGGRVLDPAAQLDAVRDVGVRHGKIAMVEEEIDPSTAGDVVDVSGRWVMPGMVDTHVHIAWASSGITDPSIGLRMVVEAGATTVMDLGGSAEQLADGIRRRGAGANVCGLGRMQPGVTLESDNPSPSEVKKVLGRALDSGLLGLKMWGGYYPFSPEVTANIIATCNEEQAYVAFHVGTKESGSRLDGMRELPELLGSTGRLHVAHINAYCRGSILEPAEEISEALAILESLRGQVVSEVHLARPNFTSGACDDHGEVIADVPRNCLKLRGYPTTADGIRQALRDGYASTVRQSDSGVQLISGEAGVAIFDELRTVTPMSFPVNRADTAFQLTVARRADRSFIVDAIASDAGALPRNVNIEQAMRIHRFGGLEPLDVAAKLSYNPARMLGLESKGRLKPGADADVTVIDPERGKAVMGIVNGRIIMIDGRAVGSGGTLLVSPRGEKAAKEYGLDYEILDVSRGLLYNGAA